MLAAIVIPVHNALPYLQATLTYLASEDKHPVICVNDCSQQDTADYLQAWAIEDTRRTVLHNPVQQLFTRTINRGIRKAYEKYDPEFIITMNSDCQLKEDWDTALLNIMNEEDIGLAGYRDSTPANLPEAYEEVQEPGYITGHLCILRTSALLKTGVSCESDITGTTFPEFAPYKGLAHIGSDRLLSYTMNRHGYRTVYCNHQGVDHEAGKSWNHNLGWLSSFNLEPLWAPKDTL